MTHPSHATYDFWTQSKASTGSRDRRHLAGSAAASTCMARPSACRARRRYSGTTCYQCRGASIAALPWPDLLLNARDRIEAVSGFRTNFAVGNRHLTGKDSIGWHSDSFPQIGEHLAIASLSLGSTRLFELRRTSGGRTFDYLSESGTLLIMLAGCQDE